MKVAFFSNYLNSHWTDFCDELYSSLGSDFIFFSRVLSKEKLDSRGTKKACNNRPYVRIIYENEIDNLVRDVIANFDIVIVGSNNSDIYQLRLKTRKLLIRVAERSIKNRGNVILFILRKIKYFLTVGKKNNEVLFSLSSQCISDYRFTGAYRNRIFDFGYFPPLSQINDSQLKKKKGFSFIWVGRFVHWKHPEIAINVIKKLIKLGYNPTLTMVGNGKEFSKISKKIRKNGLDNNILLVGQASQENTRMLMKNSKYFLLTSDSGEGWGAVLNEAMNEGCIPFASKFAGSTGFLIQHGFNGFITKNTVNDIIKKIQISLKNDEHKIAENAYLTIKNEWNGNNAAHKFINMIENYEKTGNLIGYESGVLKKSVILKSHF